REYLSALNVAATDMPALLDDELSGSGPLAAFCRQLVELKAESTVPLLVELALKALDETRALVSATRTHTVNETKLAAPYLVEVDGARALMLVFERASALP